MDTKMYRLVPVTKEEKELTEAVEMDVHSVDDILVLKVPTSTIENDELNSILELIDEHLSHRDVIILSDGIEFLKLEEIQ